MAKGRRLGRSVVALVDDFGWAQRAAVPSHRMAVLPETVTFAQAATLPVAGLTAFAPCVTEERWLGVAS